MNSLWHQTASRTARPALLGERKTEVAVIGGGLAGVLTAALLKAAGVDALVLEAKELGSGQTGNTTAKVTAQHGCKYGRLTWDLGAEAAGRYAQANQEAVEDYARLIRDQKIPCGWERTSAYLYATRDQDALLREAEAQRQAGLPVELKRKTGLPFPAPGAAELKNQASFHPLKLLYFLAQDLKICENSRVRSLDGDTLVTDGGSVRAEKLIFACHFPFVNVPGYYPLRMHQERSYVLALSGCPKLPGMYYSVEPGGLSLRPCGDLLLVGGGGHRTGENRSGGRYGSLSKSAALLFPGSREVCRWSAQDCMPLDGVPYIGRFSAATPRWLVATGFGKWGMTSAMVSAQILKRMVLGEKLPDWAGVFDPLRFTPGASAKALLDEGSHAAKGLARQLLAPGHGGADALPPGHGGVVEVDGRKVGLYKAPDGQVFAVDPRCPHLGCELTWNGDEATWDCPCHGSRFDVRGRLLDGPAQEGADVN